MLGISMAPLNFLQAAAAADATEAAARSATRHHRHAVVTQPAGASA
jgi:hypothetical protein